MVRSWNVLNLFLNRKASRRRPFRRSTLALEQLESRLVPAVNVLTYHYDTTSSGLNANETQLTPANVVVNNFGKLFTVTAIDGQVYAQPLVDTGVTIAAGVNTSSGAAGVHDVVFAATQHDTLFAIDTNPTNNGAVLWKRDFTNITPSYVGTTAGTNINNPQAATAITSVPQPDIISGDVSVEIGITGTPVIDPATNTLYVVTKTKETISGTATYVQRLHAINIGDGTDRAQPYQIGNTTGTNTNTTNIFVNGTGSGNVGGVVQFNSLREAQRPALSLVGNQVYVGWASHGDNGPYHGWVVVWNVANLTTTGFQLTGVLCTSPNNGLAGIWQGGGRLVFDPDIVTPTFYFETGNGSGGAPTLNGSGFPTNANYNEALVKVQPDTVHNSSANQNANGWGLQVVDYFIPYNVVALDGADSDFGSGAPLILPDSAGITGHAHMMLAAGKSGQIYLVDRDNMGHFTANNDNVINSVPDGSGHNTPPVMISGSLSTAAYFNGKIYWVPGYATTVTGSDNKAKNYIINSNGTLSIASETSVNNFGYLPGSVVVTANGTTNGISWVMDRNLNLIRAYDAATFSTELWNSGQKTGGADNFGAAEKFAPPTVANGEVFVGTTNSLVVYGLVAAPTAVPNAPVLSATALSGTSISLTWTDSSSYPNTANTYSIEDSTDNSTFSVVATASAGATSIALGGLQQTTKYYFRIRGQNSFNSNSGYSAYSNTANATTTNQVFTLDFSGGFAGAASKLTFNGSIMAPVGTKLELTSGANNQNTSAFSTNPVDVTQFNSQFTFQETNATADGFTFTIQGVGPTALGTGGGALGYQGISPSVAIKFDIYSNNGEGTDSTGLYTNGAVPQNVGSIDLTGTGITLRSTDICAVNMIYDGTTLSVTITDTVTNASATQNYTINIPGTIGGTTAYVGFTGATGGANSTQDILTWTYAPLATASPNAPSGLGASPASATSALLTWTNNATNQVGFHLDRATNAGFTQNLITQTIAASATSFTDMATGLAPSLTFYYRLRAYNSAGDSGNSNTASVFIPVAPPKPTDQQVDNVTATEIDISWQDNAGHACDGYHILRAINHGTFAQVATLPQTSRTPPSRYGWSDTNLTPDTFYEYHIVCFNSSGNNDFAGVNATTLAAPGGVDFGSGFADASGLAYNGPAFLNGSNLQLTGNVTNQASSVFTTFAVSAVGFINDFTFQQQPGTTPTGEGLTFAIQAISPHVRGVAGGGLGYGPSAAGGAGGIANSIAVKFDLNSNQGEGPNSTGLYTNGAAPTGNLSVNLSGTGVNLHSADIFNASMIYNGTTLQVTITDTATNASATQSYPINIPTLLGSSVGYIGFTGSTGTQTAVQNILTWFYAPSNIIPPNAPSSLIGSVTASPPYSVNLTWSDNSTDETGFLIDRAQDAAFTQNLITFQTGANATATGAYSDSAVVSGITYYYRVRSTNLLFASTSTNTVVVNVGTGPTAPTGLAATLATTTEIDLAWQNNAANATNNEVLRKILPSGYLNTVAILPAGSTSFKDVGLSPGTNFFYEVAALNNGVPGGYANFTQATVSLAPTALTATGGAGQVVLLWTPPAGAVTYNVYRGTAAGGESATPYQTGVTATSFTDTNVVPALNYFYTVSAVNPVSVSPVNAGGESAHSSEAFTFAQIGTGSGGPNFPNGFTGATGLTFNGVAALSGSHLRLTTSSTNLVGSAFSTNPFSIAAFSTTFTFQAQGNNTGEGLTFTIQGVSNHAIGRSGGGLGYGPTSPGGAGGIANSVAIKFDLNSNQGEGPNSTGLYTNGAAPTATLSTNLTGTGIDLHNGHVFSVTLSYDGTTLQATIVDTATHASASQFYAINIPAIVGATSAFIGFTASTGTQTAIQDILAWIYTPTGVTPHGVIAGGGSNSNGTTTPGPLVVSSVTPTATGFTATFSESIDATKINLYDLTLSGSNGPISGSVVLSNNNQTITFVATNLELPDDMYTLSLTSGGNASPPTGAEQGFQDLGGIPLDGTGNGGSADYTTHFTTSYNTDLTVVLPGFARGPGQGVNLKYAPLDGAYENGDNGIPVQLNWNAAAGNATATTVTFTLGYNADLLAIASVVNATSPAGGTYSVTTSGAGANATATFVFTAAGSGLNVAAGAGPVTIGLLNATVPGGAAYKSKQLLDIGSLHVNNGVTPVAAVGQDGVQVVAFLGNASGSGFYTPLDASLMARYQNTAALFPAFPLADPTLIAGIDGAVDPNGITQVLQFNLNKRVPGIPAYTGAPSNNPSGADPALAVGSGQWAVGGGIVSVPVNIDDPHPAGSTGLTEATLALRYDPRVFSVSAQDIHLGTVPLEGSGWTFTAAVDAVTGQVGIILYSMTPIRTATPGSLVTIDFHVLAGASAGASPIQLVPAAAVGGQEVRTGLFDSQGILTLHQAPTGAYLPGVEELVVVATTSAPLSQVETTPLVEVMRPTREAGAETADPVPAGLTGDNDMAFLAGPSARANLAAGMVAVLPAGILPLFNFPGMVAQRLVEQVLGEQAHPLGTSNAQNRLEALLWDTTDVESDLLLPLDQGGVYLPRNHQNRTVVDPEALPAAYDAALEEYFANATDELD